MNEKQILDRLDQLAHQASMTARDINTLRTELLVSKSVSKRKPRTESGPRHTWTPKERSFIRNLARDGKSPQEIANFFNFEVSANAVQAQMYALFPTNRRDGLNFVVK